MNPPSTDKLRSILARGGPDKAADLLQRLDPAVAADAMLDLPFEDQRGIFRRMPVPFAATLVAEFRTRFVETKLFWDRFAHGTFSNYLFARQESPPQRHTKETAHQLADQANLFIDAAHACYAKIQAGAAETIKLPMLP